MSYMAGSRTVGGTRQCSAGQCSAGQDRTGQDREAQDSAAPSLELKGPKVWTGGRGQGRGQEQGSR
jgi:hypothetical protein